MFAVTAHKHEVQREPEWGALRSERLHHLVINPVVNLCVCVLGWRSPPKSRLLSAACSPNLQCRYPTHPKNNHPPQRKCQNFKGPHPEGAQKLYSGGHRPLNLILLAGFWVGKDLCTEPDVFYILPLGHWGFASGVGRSPQVLLLATSLVLQTQWIFTH